MKRVIVGALGALALSAGMAASHYPGKEIRGVIQWGAGGSTGPGGLPSVITAMIATAEGGLDGIKAPYDGDGPALTGLQGGAIGVMPAVLGAAIAFTRAGAMKPPAFIDLTPNDRLPDAPAITTFNKGFETCLPWGPFFGVFAGALGHAIGAVGRDPLTFTERFTFDLTIVQNGSSFIAVMIGRFGLTGVRLFMNIVETPRSVLIPMILLLSIVGAVAVDNAVGDVY